jgi:hypothetical protein
MNIEEKDCAQFNDVQDEDCTCVERMSSVFTKGRTWRRVNLEVLPNIDFDVIENKTNLTLDDTIRKYIEIALAEYVCGVRSLYRPLSSERNKALNDVEDACKLLESFLELDTPGKLSESEYDSMNIYLYNSVTPSVKCFVDEGVGLPRLIVKKRDLSDNEKGDVRFNGKNVSDYLASCRKKIDKLRSWPVKTGRPENLEIRRCLRSLRMFYNMAGGEGRGVRRSVDGSFSGPFLTFSKLLLDHLQKPLGLAESPFSETALGALVVNKYKI